MIAISISYPLTLQSFLSNTGYIQREEKLKAARDKLEKFRKKKNSSRPEGSISGGPDGPGGLDGPDGSISPFPTAPAEEVYKVFLC